MHRWKLIIGLIKRQYVVKPPEKLARHGRTDGRTNKGPNQESQYG